LSYIKVIISRVEIMFLKKKEIIMKKFLALFLAVSMLLPAITIYTAAEGAAQVKKLEWVFDKVDDTKGWTIGNARYKVNEGYIEGLSTKLSNGTADPTLSSPALNINASDYRYLVAVMKHNCDATYSMNPEVFFTTDTHPNLAADAHIAGPKAVQNQATYINVVFDMSTNDFWKGTVKSIRFDPFNVPGMFSIKSIMLCNEIPPDPVEPTAPVTPQTPTDETPKKAIGVFEKSATYTDGLFSDVSSDAWYSSEVKNAYELGLVNGKGEGTFDPDGTMTVAEAITLAARTFNNYNTADFVFQATKDQEWYLPYVNYAINNGIIKDGQFDSYARQITRAEMATVFCKHTSWGSLCCNQQCCRRPPMSQLKTLHD